MNLKIKRTVLLNALTKVSRAVSLKSPLPVLTGIKFDLKHDHLTLTGSDSDITIQTTINDNLEVIEEGAVVLASRYILEIIRKIEGEFINIYTIEGDLTRIESTYSKFDLNGTNYLDYPRINLDATGSHFTIKALKLKEAIEQTLFATSDQETRPPLTGVNFKAKNNTLECIATDSYRLAKKTLYIDSDITFSIIIPKKSLTEISRIIEKNEDIDLYVSDRKLLVIIGSYYLQTRLIDGAFPETSRLFADESDRSLTINAMQLLNSLDRASLLSNEANHVVKLSMSDEEVKLTSYSKEIGSVEDNLSTSFYKGEALTISFSSRYMNEAIKSINSDKIVLSFSGSMRPITIKNIDKDDIVQIVLPVRTY